MDDDELTVIEPRPLRKIDWLIIGVDFVRSIVSEVENALSKAELVLCSHANHEAEQRDFADAIRRDIETLTQED